MADETTTTTQDKQITIEVPEDRIAEFYAFYARFLAGRGPRGRRGRRPHRGRHGHGHGCGRERGAEGAETGPSTQAEPTVL